MDHLIKFRHFADSVSQNEFESLMPAISNVIGKDTLISLLYDHLHSKLNVSEYNAISKLQQINDEIATVVNQNTPLTQPKLDKIPSSLINDISSYLDLRSYTKFERCNRTIFIAARSPLQLQHINDSDIRQYIRYCNKNKQKMNKSRFYRAKSLTITPYSFDQKWNGQFLLFGNLQSLSINFRNENILKDMVHQKNIKLTKLSKLTLKNNTSSSNESSINNILQKTSNLKYLDLAYKHHPPTLQPNTQNIIRNLSGLSLLNNYYNVYDPSRDISLLISLENDILNACTSELTSFHTGSELCFLQFNHILFPNLTELCLQNNYNPNVISVINKFNHLKRLKFNVSDFNDIKMELTIKFMNDLLSLTKLESIDFGDILQDRMPMLFKLIQNGLMMHKKKKLKIYMYCIGASDECVGGDIHIDLELFVNSLEFLISHDFMFIFSFDDIPKSQKENIQKWLNGLDDTRFCCINKDFFHCYFVVANKGCKINTCRKEWDMKCVSCAHSCYADYN